MEALKGKKLLILGGNALSSDIVLKAKELEVYTIVTDWNSKEESPAKLKADESWQVSLMDYDLLLKMIQKNHVDGVITGFTDSYLIPYATLCSKADLPSYATAELFENSLDKSLFKMMCRRNNVPVVSDYEPSFFDRSLISNNNKVIIKPVDNSGSRGIIICDAPEKYQSSLDYALRYSKKKKVIIERFLEMDQISVSYTIQDGIVSLSTINDDFLYRPIQQGSVNCGGRYPSKYINFYINNINENVISMLQNEGYKNGVLFMQAFTDGVDLYFFEMGYRLSGGRHYIFTKHQNSSSSLEQLIHFALTGRMADYSIKGRDNPYFNKACYRFNLIGNPGIISKIDGYDYLQTREETIFVSLLKKEGDQVGDVGTTATQLLGAYVAVDDLEHFNKFLDDVYSHVRFLDANGNNLVQKIYHN